MRVKKARELYYRADILYEYDLFIGMDSDNKTIQASSDFFNLTQKHVLGMGRIVII